MNPGSFLSPASPGTVLIVILTVLCASAMGQSLGPAQAEAPTFTPAPGQMFFLDLDSASGVFSQWRHDSLGTLNVLRAVLRVPRIRKDSHWLPTFSVYLQGEGDPLSAEALGLQIFEQDRKLPLRMRLILGRLNGRPIQEIQLQTTLRLNDHLRVEMRWAAPQLVTIVVGDSEVRNVTVSWPICRALIISSTGELKVDPLVLGTVKP